MDPVFLFTPTFVSYGLEHISWLIAGALSTWFCINLARSKGSDLEKRRIGLLISLIPAVLWLSIALYMAFFVQPLDLGLVLPFHVCYFLNLMMPVLLWRRSYFLFEVSYFMIMAGCVQALLTPDMQTTFPDHLNVRYFVTHICLAQSILFAVFVYDFRPTWRSLMKSLLWSNIYFVFIIGVNALLDTNFMYLRAKPTSATMLDLFGEWPWYILGGELMAVVLFIVVMLPFAFQKKTLA